MSDPILVSSLGRRRRFSEEFKSEIVAEALTSGKPLAQIARTYDLGQSLLHKWIRDAKDSAKCQIVSDQSSFIRIEHDKVESKECHHGKYGVRIRISSRAAIEISDRLSFSEIAQLSRELGAPI